MMNDSHKVNTALSLILPLMVRTMEVVVVSFRSGLDLRIQLVQDQTAGLVYTLTTPKRYRRTS